MLVRVRVPPSAPFERSEDVLRHPRISTNALLLQGFLLKGGLI